MSAPPCHSLAPGFALAYLRRVLDGTDQPRAPHREPALNIPGVVSALLGAMAVIEAVRSFLLGPEGDFEVLALFAFIPARYDPNVPFTLPGGVGAQVWTFFTYALLHANWIHLLVNGVWMLAFASPVARRFGTLRFTLFFAVTAAAGAVAQLVSSPGSLVPMIGASAAVSGAMAAAVRFVFAPGGALGPSYGHRYGAPGHPPANSLAGTLRDRRVLTFILIWLAVNLIFGVWVPVPGEEGAEVAWQAHMGGFFAGLLLFPWFDPVPRSTGGSTFSR